MRICEHHFVEEDFVSSYKKKLKKSSVPQKYNTEEDNLQVLTPVTTYTKQHSMPSPKIVQTKRKLCLSKNKKSPSQKMKSAIPSPMNTELHVLTPTIGKLQTSITPDEYTPKTKKLMTDMLDFLSPIKPSLKPTNLFAITSPNNNTIIELKNIIKKQKQILATKRSTISKLKKYINSSKLQNKSKLLNLMDSLKFPSEDSKTLVKMQVCRKKLSTSPWSYKEQQLALSLFYKSPSVYKFLKSAKKINLPGLTSIKRWIGRSKFRPGFNPALFKQLKIKAESMTEEEKYCILVFDEMKIKNFLEYSKYLDVVEGFEDLGSKGRTNKLAGQAMVFIIRGMYSSWKMPIAYFLPATSVKHNDLSDLIIEAVEHIIKCGLLVKAIVCDQGTNNVAAFKDLNMSKVQPYFLINEKKIYSVFDVPHLFKNLRNHFIKSNFKFDGELASFDDVRATYHFDKNSSTSRSLLHITDSHINPGSFQKMNCKLALQIFSHRVATAMQTCVMTGQLTSKTAPHTVRFIKKMNDLLDCLNSNTLFHSNPSKNALSDRCPSQLELLQKCKCLFETLEKISHNPSQKLKDTRPISFDGMVWTINAMIMLYEEQKGAGFNYLLTRRINSDVIENMFSVFRQRGGYNRNPTVRTFRTTFRINVKSSLMNPSSLSNCEPDNDIHLFSKDDDEPMKNIPDNEETSDSNSSCLSSMSSIVVPLVSNVEPNVTLEICSNNYFAGYLGKKCQDKFKCDVCSKLLLKQDDNNNFNREEFLIFCRNYESDSSDFFLRKPTPNFAEFIYLAQQIIKKTVEKMPHKINLGTFLCKKIKNDLGNVCQFNDACGDHFKFIVEHLVNCKLLRDFNWKSKNIKKGRVDKTKNKLNILKNN